MSVEPRQPTCPACLAGDEPVLLDHEMQPAPEGGAGHFFHLGGSAPEHCPDRSYQSGKAMRDLLRKQIRLATDPPPKLTGRAAAMVRRLFDKHHLHLTYVPTGLLTGGADTETPLRVAQAAIENYLVADCGVDPERARQLIADAMTIRLGEEHERRSILAKSIARAEKSAAMKAANLRRKGEKNS